MNRRDVLTRHRRSRRRRADDGSAIVSAVVVGMLVATAVTVLSARAVGGSMASAAQLQRAQAVALAEYGLAAGIAELDAGLALELQAAMQTVEHSIAVVIPDSIDVAGPVSVDVRVHFDGETGSMLLSSTGDVGGRARSVSARVRTRTTVDYLLVTSHEVIDPMLFRRPRAGCATTRGDEARDPECIDTALPVGVLDGPVHSNDLVQLNAGVTIASMLTTSQLIVEGDQVRPRVSPGSDVDIVAGWPFGLHHATEITLPRAHTQVVRNAQVTCRFRGPTLIRFDGASIRVTSPRSVTRAGDALHGESAIGCQGVDRDLLVGPTSILLPERAMIEIVRDTASDCVEHPLGIALDEDGERDWWCSDGDAFVWGTYRGARTVIAEDNIQLVWDVVPSSRAATLEPDGSSIGAVGDVLGLIAGDSVVLRRLVGRPIRRVAPYGPNIAFAGPSIPPFGDYPQDAPTEEATTWDEPVIVAAVVALRGSVGVQNPRSGQEHPGAVQLSGSIATRFRGLFSWEHRSATGAVLGSMGYPVVLRYDPNLLELAPPGMPVTAGGAVRVLGLEYGP